MGRRRPGYIADRNAEHKVRINAFRKGPCKDCGRAFPPAAMEFDHVRGEKRAGVGTMVSWAPATVLAELAKCDAVCANCRRVRTACRRPLPKQPDPTLPRWKYNKALAQAEKVAVYRERLNEIKKRPCGDCGDSYHPTAMDFDHIGGVKNFSISNGWQKPWPLVENELALCELVCANCHRLRTEIRRSAPAAA